MSDHTMVITGIDHIGVEARLECHGHDRETCDLYSWWHHVDLGDICDLQDLNVRIPVDATWTDDGPKVIKAEVPDE